MRKTDLTCLAVFLLTTLTGCASMSYDSLKIGDPPKAYNDVLPRAQTRHFPLGRIYLSDADDGETTAICLLLGDNRRVIGKLMAKHVDRMDRWPGGLVLAYDLVGEIDQAGLALDEASPEDVARFLRSYLDQPYDDSRVRHAASLLSVGLAAVVDADAALEQYAQALPKEPASDPNAPLTALEQDSEIWRVPPVRPAVSAIKDEQGILTISVVWD